MRCLVTGVSGFIGSHLAERLLRDGCEVVGVDCYTDFYPRALKEGNLSRVREDLNFCIKEVNLASIDLDPILDGIDVIYHQAAQAGVRSSWGNRFSDYTENNVLSTQRLLEAAKSSLVRKFVYASSSSVYGNTLDLPMKESSLPAPYSPYGVTKLAAEQMCELYRHNFDVPTISLRYFTVYGPRQRPDMGFNRFIRMALTGETIPIYGDGEQTRDFTYISDIVEANILAGGSDSTGVFNIAGGSRVTLNETLGALQEISGLQLNLENISQQHGDARHTWADTEAAQSAFGFAPTVGLRQGLAAQIAWQSDMFETEQANAG